MPFKKNPYDFFLFFTFKILKYNFVHVLTKCFISYNEFGVGYVHV